jgi:hypothetical protein
MMNTKKMMMKIMVIIVGLFVISISTAAQATISPQSCNDVLPEAPPSIFTNHQYSGSGNSFGGGYSFGDGNDWNGHYENYNYSNNLTFQRESVASVPIPAAIWLLGSGLIGVVVMRRRAKA